nr:MAG TPA: hypothetical protein [Caudoviricetes sp.]
MLYKSYLNTILNLKSLNTTFLDISSTSLLKKLSKKLKSKS